MKNSSPKEEVSLTEEELLLVADLRTAIRNHVGGFVGRIAYDIAQRVFIEEFVATAHRALLENGNERVTQSQVGWITGVCSEGIRDILNASTAKVTGPLTIEERVIWTWQTDFSYRCRETGAPEKLLILGPRGTFQGLVAGVVRGVTPHFALQSLLAAGRVEVVDSHWVKLTRPEPRFQPNMPSPPFSAQLRTAPGRPE